MHSDFTPYFNFASPLRLEKCVDTLAGIVQGIQADSVIRPQELEFLHGWIDEHEAVRDRHPFNEVMPVIEAALSDGVLSDDERDDILWLCDRILSDRGRADEVTSGMRRLHGILGGIVADREINAEELDTLAEWLDDHRHLRTIWPYDEIDSLVTGVLADRVVTSDEQTHLMAFFGQFVEVADDRVIADPVLGIGEQLVGLCAVDPEIRFDGAKFCLTGASARLTRSEFTHLIQSRGGRVMTSVSKFTDYLVVGADGNPCWAYACYGRKVEAAARLRREGARVVIVHELDFFDAVEA